VTATDPGGQPPAVVLLLGGIGLLVASTFVAIRVGRRLSHEGRREEAAGLAMVMMITNLLQLAGVVFILIAVFGP